MIRYEKMSSVCNSMTPLIEKYRPQSFDEMIGQAEVVKSLQGICERKDVQVFLLTGPSGVGKTTLAGIVAKEMGCESIIDVDAADQTGVEDMRKLKETMQYQGFSRRAIIIDECHRLSPQAFDSLLKVLERENPFVFWFFCTTNPTKVPKTIRTRCATFELSLVEEKHLWRLYDTVCQQEAISLSDDIGGVLIQAAEGSPRQLLSNIAVARTATSPQEAAKLLKVSLDTDATRELCQYLIKGGSWRTGMSIVEKLKDQNPESVRTVVCLYMAACLRNAKTDKDAVFFLERMEHFSTPYVYSEGSAGLLLSIGRALFSGS